MGDVPAIGLRDAVSDRGGELRIDRTEPHADEAALPRRIDLEAPEIGIERAILVALGGPRSADADQPQQCGQRVGRSSGAVELGLFREPHLADDLLAEVRRHQRAHVGVDGFLVHPHANAIGHAGSRRIGERVGGALRFDGELRLRHIAGGDQREHAVGGRRQGQRDERKPRQASDRAPPQGAEVDIVRAMVCRSSHFGFVRQIRWLRDTRRRVRISLSFPEWDKL